MKKILIGLLMIAGCASPGGLFGETVGEKFRKALANVDAVCRERKIGPYLDPNDPEYRRKSGLMNCEVLKIKPYDHAAVLATPEGKFAYSIQLPPPLDKPRVRRADYRSAEEYFEALCEREVIQVSLKGPAYVEGVAFMRAPLIPWRNSLSSYSEEFAIGSVPTNPEELLVRPNSPFVFVERMVRAEERKQFPIAKYLRFERSPTDTKKFLVQPIERISAKYGYVVRGTESFNDRESGIWGGEVLLVDLSTNDVVGIWRAFGRDAVDTSYTDQVRYWGQPCPGTGGRDYSHFLFNMLQAKERK